jgi:hypothetical protein
MEDLRRGRSEPEIECQLPVPRCEQVSKDRPEARAFPQFGVGLPDRCQIRERVEDFTVGTM